MMMVNYDGLAREYAQHRGTLPAVTEALIEGGSLTRDSQVLELGCGTGNYIRALEETVGCASWGVDRSEEMLAHARARAGDVAFMLGDAARLGFADNSFDLVFSVDVIHHIDAKADFYKEAYRVLVPGGRLCTMTDSEELIRNSMVLSRYFPETVPVNIARYPTVGAHREWMTRAGFREFSEAVVSHPVTVTDSGCYASKANSTLHMIPADAFERGLMRLERDLAAGPVTGLRRYLGLWGTKPMRAAAL
jgi:ubiquinone/menaquinone biosynthesis C-methylase UbiE